MAYYRFIMPYGLGVTEEMLDGIAAGTLAMEGGYKAPNHDEIVEILKASMEENDYE